MFKLIRSIQAILLFASGLAVSAQALTYITNFSNNTWYLIPLAEQAPAPKGGIPASLSEGRDMNHQGPQKQVWLDPEKKLPINPKSTMVIDLYDSMRNQSSIRFSLVDHRGNNPHQVILALGYREASGHGQPRVDSRRLMIPNGLSPRALGFIKGVCKLEGNRLIVAANSWTAAGAAELPPQDLPVQHAAAANLAPASASAPPLPRALPVAGVTQKPSTIPSLPMLSPRAAASAASAPVIPANAPKPSRFGNQHLTIRNESRLPMELTLANLEVTVLLRASSSLKPNLAQTTLPPGEALSYIIPGGTTLTMSCLGAEAQLPFSVNFALGDGQSQTSSFLWTFLAPSAPGQALPQAVLTTVEGQAAPPFHPGSLHLDAAASCITFKRGGRRLPLANPAHLPM